ncbi:hypothetical protein GCM10028798_28510 [Humibacter antri]
MTVVSARPETHVGVDPTIGFRRVAGAVMLPLAFACQLVCNVTYAVAADGNAGDGGTGEQSLEFYASHASSMVLATVFALVGCLLAVPGILAALRILRPSKPRLGLWAAVLMIAGYVAYFGLSMTNFDSLALARSDLPRAAAGAVLDAAQGSPAAMPVFIVFVAGNLVGTLLLGLAVVLGGRRCGVPWWAGLLVIAWTVGHVINIVGGGEWFAVAGGALEVVGLAFLAAAVLRTSDTEWSLRG